MESRGLSENRHIRASLLLARGGCAMVYAGTLKTGPSSVGRLDEVLLELPLTFLKIERFMPLSILCLVLRTCAMCNVLRCGSR